MWGVMLYVPLMVRAVPFKSVGGGGTEGFFYGGGGGGGGVEF